MRYLSLFSGIEAATLAWKPLGWECVGVAEIDNFPCAMLAHHYPNVQNLGDVTEITERQIASLGHIDVIIFGSPCQDLSVAGKQKGLAGERSGLFHTAIDIVGWAREHCELRYALWENVPGAFTSNKGRDFACVVEAMAGLPAGSLNVPPKGWGNEGVAVGEEALVEWSTLDAQWFGVAQRRRRVFALADFGDWTRRPPILLEPESMRGDSAPRRRSREEVAGTLTRGLGERGAEDGERGLLQVVCITGSVTHALTAEGFDASEDGTGRGCPIVAYGGNNTAGPIDVSTALNAKGGAGRMDFESETLLIGFYPTNRQPENGNYENVAPTLKIGSGDASSANAAGVAGPFGVRRFTPLECERLQGKPDGYTNITYRGKPAADGPRYKALGNGMAVPVIRWIGKQIEMCEWEWV